MRNRIVFLLALVLTLMVLVVANNKIPTGFATFATKEEARSVINVGLADPAFRLLGEGAEICSVVEIDAETTYYYKIEKSGDMIGVQEAYCAEPGQDNIIIKFNSYDDLLDARSGPMEFFTGRKNTGYYFFPSNYIEEGGSLKCTQSFQQSYCAPFYYYARSSQLAAADLACCANYQITDEQKKMIQELKKGKPSELAAPLQFLFSTTGIVAVIIIIVLIIIITSFVVMKPKNPLAGYVKSTREQGYSDEEIKSALIESGWQEDVITDALKK